MFSNSGSSFVVNGREVVAPAEAQFLDLWSPRAFLSEKSGTRRHTSQFVFQDTLPEVAK